FALQLADALADGVPPVRVWMDRRRLRPGEYWDEQLVEAIQECDALLFVMTRDSVRANSVCKQEWTRALKYKKPIIPIRLHRDAETPFRLEPRQHVDFARLRRRVKRLRENLVGGRPAGVLRELEATSLLTPSATWTGRRTTRTERKCRPTSLPYRNASPSRSVSSPTRRLPRKPSGASSEAWRSSAHRRPRRGPATRASGSSTHHRRCATYFQNRTVETGLVADWLADDSVRLVTVTGRAGIGKTSSSAASSRRWSGRLPDGGELDVDGIVYLTARSRSVAFLNLYTDLRVAADADLRPVGRALQGSTRWRRAEDARCARLPTRQGGGCSTTSRM
ncbi:MAG: toll/interleukin-1 receptor domain-containing protein, partial [Chloroflexia bacterium]